MIKFFEKEYINGDGLKWKCGIKLICNKEQNSYDISQSREFHKDTSKNRLPLWNALSDLIKEAIKYAEEVNAKDVGS